MSTLLLLKKMKLEAFMHASKRKLITHQKSKEKKKARWMMEEICFRAGLDTYFLMLLGLELQEKQL